MCIYFTNLFFSYSFHFSHQRLTEYRNSLTTECKSERSNATVNTPQSISTDVNNRVYSTPAHLAADNKHGEFIKLFTHISKWCCTQVWLRTQYRNSNTTKLFFFISIQDKFLVKKVSVTNEVLLTIFLLVEPVMSMA